MRARERLYPWRETTMTKNFITCSLIVCFLTFRLPVVVYGAPSLHELPVTLQDDRGNSRSFADFSSRPLVLTLAYTHCKSACPLTMQRLMRIERHAEAAHQPLDFAVISLDPKNDTLETLKHFREQYQLTSDRWHFFRLSEEDLRLVSIFLDYKYRSVDEEADQIVHSNKIYLVNPNGEVRLTLEGLTSDVSELVDAIPKP